MRIIVRMPRFLPGIDAPITVYHESDAVFVDETTGQELRTNYLHLYYYPAPWASLKGIISIRDENGDRTIRVVESVVFERNSVPVISFFD